MIHELWKNVDATVYVRISVDPLDCSQWVIYANFGPKEWGFFINFIRILRFLQGLGLVLSDIPRDSVFV